VFSSSARMRDREVSFLRDRTFRDHTLVVRAAQSFAMRKIFRAQNITIDLDPMGSLRTARPVGL